MPTEAQGVAVGVASGAPADTCASGLRVRIRIDVCGFAVANNAKSSPTKKTARPVKIDRFKKADRAVCFVFMGISYGRGAGVGRLLGPGLDRGVGLGRGVAVGVDVGVAVAVAVAVGVGVGLSVAAQYLPPVFKYPPLPIPPHTIISLPIHTAV